MIKKVLIYRYFIDEICRKYNDSLVIFQCKKKKQFISFPFNITQVTLRNVSHLVELAESPYYFNLSDVESCQGFDLEGLYTTQLRIVKYENLFTRVKKESEESQITPQIIQ